MVLDLLTLTAIPTAVGASEAVHQQRLLDEAADSEKRKAPFYLDVFCDAKSRKCGEVDGGIVVLSGGKLWITRKNASTGLPKKNKQTGKPSFHPFTGLYLPFPTQDLPHRPIPAPPVLGLVSTIPPAAPPQKVKAKSEPKSNLQVKSLESESESEEEVAKETPRKPKLNWIYADRRTREICYAPRATARDHIVGPWDWTDGDEQGVMLSGEESLVVVEEEDDDDDDGEGGEADVENGDRDGGEAENPRPNPPKPNKLKWKVYWDRDDDLLKSVEGIVDADGRRKRVLRCSLERRLCEEGRRAIEVE